MKATKHVVRAEADALRLRAERAEEALASAERRADAAEARGAAIATDAGIWAGARAEIAALRGELAKERERADSAEKGAAVTWQGVCRAVGSDRPMLAIAELRERADLAEGKVLALKERVDEAERVLGDVVAKVGQLGSRARWHGDGTLRTVATSHLDELEEACEAARGVLEPAEGSAPTLPPRSGEETGS